MAFWKRKSGPDGKDSKPAAPSPEDFQVGDPLAGLATATPPKAAPNPAGGPAPSAPAKPAASAKPAMRPLSPSPRMSPSAPNKPSAPKAPAPVAPPASPPPGGAIDESEAAARFKGQGVDQMVNELEAAGLFRKDQIDEVYRRASEAESAASLRKELAVTGLANEQDMIEAIAQSIGMERITLFDLRVAPEVIGEISAKVARQYHIFPIESSPDSLTVAVSDPLNVYIADELSLKLGKTIVSKLASDVEIEQAIARHYDKDNIGSIIQSTIDDEEQRIAQEKLDSDDEEEDDLAQQRVIDLDHVRDQNEPAVVQFVNLLFRESIHQRASDIHIEPTRFSTCIRLRIDGVLHEMPSPPKKWERMIISRLKVMSGMDLAEKRIPQDGRIQLTVEGKNLDLRVSCLPAIHGESIVMRILDQASILLGLEDVGFLADNIRIFNRLIRSPNGVILMTGPTGSGKTTTLNAALNVLNNPETKLVTIEDPVEYQVQGVNQIQVNTEVGLTFAAALRAVLRQSPDIIMVGEIRDAETAEAATRAALTGHLVFSTLHTNDAASATVRLIDIGIAPFLVASAIQAVIAQRLIRTVCVNCKTPYVARAQEIESVGVNPDDFGDKPLVVGRGCERCSHTGYRGRTAIHEIFEMNPELRQMVIRRESSTRLKAVAVRNGMRTLRLDGWEKIKMHNTTIEEVMRITALD